MNHKERRKGAIPQPSPATPLPESSHGYSQQVQAAVLGQGLAYMFWALDFANKESGLRVSTEAADKAFWYPQPEPPLVSIQQEPLYPASEIPSSQVQVGKLTGLWKCLSPLPSMVGEHPRLCQLQGKLSKAIGYLQVKPLPDGS